jgi:hypothetical protein
MNDGNKLLGDSQPKDIRYVFITSGAAEIDEKKNE